jgi:hypothetical protein
VAICLKLCGTGQRTLWPGKNPEGTVQGIQGGANIVIEWESDSLEAKFAATLLSEM